MTAPKKFVRQPRIVSRRGLALAAMGLEAEFTVVVDGEPVTPERVFGSPTAFVREPLMHRVGRSYHLPTGGAVYFDTGVIEVATPIIEIERGAPARAGRSLWESIHFVRDELDAWQRNHHTTVHLGGFSTHYNVSFDLPNEERRRGRSVETLALLLTHILPFPVMLLSANKRSTGIGVRPRGNRVEVTADFTPDPALMIATATLIVGVVREVMTWRRFTHDELDAHGVPITSGFRPEPHSSRKGWVARHSCFRENPFMCDVDARVWHTTSGALRSLREMAQDVTRVFWPSIRRVGDPFSLRLIRAVLSGRSPSLLELPDRPVAYERVGELCRWDDLFPEERLSRSRYERVMLHAINGDHLRIGRDQWQPVAMRGWSHVVFRRRRDRARKVWSLDDVLARADRWEQGERRKPPRLARRSSAEAVVPGVPTEAPPPDERAAMSDTVIMPADRDLSASLTPSPEPEVSAPASKRRRRRRSDADVRHDDSEAR
jgi:hypothetical protein